MTDHEDGHNDTDTPKELGAIVQLEREELQSRVPEWDDVAAGKLTVQEASERIRERGAQTEDEIAEAAALFAPPNNGFEQKLVDRLAGSKSEDARENVVQMPANRWRLPLVGGVAAIAAALLLWWAGSTGTDTVQPSDDGVAIAVPSHEMWIEKTAEVRGDASDEAPELPAGSTMTFFLRPQQAYAADPIVWACAEQGQKKVALSVHHERHGEVVEAKATLPPEMATGEWTLLAFVSHAPAPASPCAATPSETLRVQRQPFVVTPR